MPSRLRRSRDADRSRTRRDDRKDEKSLAEKMPFGEHKGKAIKELPSAYIEWAVVNLQESPILDRLTDELIRRKSTKGTV